MTEEVNHPTHYHKESGHEAIDVIHAWGLSFDVGNAVKYLARCGHKSTSKDITDLEKAVWYLQDELARKQGVSGDVYRNEVAKKYLNLNAPAYKDKIEGEVSKEVQEALSKQLSYVWQWASEQHTLTGKTTSIYLDLIGELQKDQATIEHPGASKVKEVMGRVKDSIESLDKLYMKIEEFKQTHSHPIEKEFEALEQMVEDIRLDLKKVGET